MLCRRLGACALLFALSACSLGNASTTRTFRTHHRVKLPDGRTIKEIGYQIVSFPAPAKCRLDYTYETDVDLSHVDAFHVDTTVPKSLGAETNDLWENGLRALVEKKACTSARIVSSTVPGYRYSVGYELKDSRWSGPEAGTFGRFFSAGFHIGK